MEAAAAARAEAIATMTAECPSLIIIPQTKQLLTLMTIIRDRETNPIDFVFYSNRIIRMLCEAGLEEMPHELKTVMSPTGVEYAGVGWTLPYMDNICGVSILRAAESMEGVLRDVCRSIKIGKILIQRDEETALPKLMYSKLPPNIARMKVLLLDPMLATGGSALSAIKVLTDAGVPAENIVFINLVCCPEGVRAMHAAYPTVKIVSASLDSHLDERKYIIPGLGDFGDRYFGTE
jgi:uracil phosphoribosyltransferase